MPSDQLWITARRALGVYFLVSALAAVPGIFASLGAEPADGTSRWLLVVVFLGNSIVMGIAGWWLVRGAVSRPDTADPVWPDSGLRIVLQVLGVYFAVAGAVDLVQWIVPLLLMSGSFGFEAGHVAGAVATLAAGLLLVARPTAIAQRIAAFP